jgi:hypothetical protein
MKRLGTTRPALDPLGLLSISLSDLDLDLDLLVRIV